MFKARRSTSLLLGVSGGLLLAALAIVASWQGALTSETAVQPDVTATISLSPAATPTTVTAEFENLGNAAELVPAAATPILNISGFLFPLGLTNTLRTPSTLSQGGLSVPLPAPGTPSPCLSNLSFVNSGSSNFQLVSGLDVFGPTNVSLVLSGAETWPAPGVGLLLPQGLSNLIVIQREGASNTSATVDYYNYTTIYDYTLVANSSAFPVSPTADLVLTVSLTGQGQYAADVNGVPRLTGSLENFGAPSGKVGAWPGNATQAIQGIYTQVNGAIDFLAPVSDCGTLVTLPFTSTTPPTVTPVGPNLRVVPASGSSPTIPDLYVLEDAIGEGALGSPVVSPGSELSLGVSETLEYDAPLEV